MHLSANEASCWAYWLARVRLPGGEDVYGTLTATDLGDATGVGREPAERALRVLAHTGTVRETGARVAGDRVYELLPLPRGPREHATPWTPPPWSLPSELMEFREIIEPRGRPVPGTLAGRLRERVMSIPGQRAKVKRREAARRRQEEAARSRGEARDVA